MKFSSSILSVLAAVCLGFAGTASSTATQTSFDVSDAALVRTLPGFTEGRARVGDVTLHYVAGGAGDPVVLLPGWPQTWWEFHKIMPALSKRYRVVAVDLRGMGGSSRPATGYDKKTMASDIAGLLRQLGHSRSFIVGHDIGSQVAFAFAANYPGMTRKLVMIDVAHPDTELAKWPLLPSVGTLNDKIGDGSSAYPWWFAYHQVKGLPEALAADGRIELEQAWFFHYLTQDDRAIDARARAVYAAAYRSREAIRAGNAWYQAFPQDILDDQTYDRLAMPVLGIAGPGYNWLNSTLARKAKNVRVIRIPNSGHFIPEERPDVLIKELVQFLN